MKTPKRCHFQPCCNFPPRLTALLSYHPNLPPTTSSHYRAATPPQRARFLSNLRCFDQFLALPPSFLVKALLTGKAFACTQSKKKVIVMKSRAAPLAALPAQLAPSYLVFNGLIGSEPEKKGGSEKFCLFPWFCWSEAVFSRGDSSAVPVSLCLWTELRASVSCEYRKMTNTTLSLLHIPLGMRLLSLEDKHIYQGSALHAAQYTVPGRRICPPPDFFYFCIFVTLSGL